MRLLIEDDGEDLAQRFRRELESALLARALLDTGGLPNERAKALLQCWLLGTFNAAALPLVDESTGLPGALNWERDGEGLRLVWLAPSGLACPLARLYQQENGTWAALVVAGVKDHLLEAMSAAEWGVSRLAA